MSAKKRVVVLISGGGSNLQSLIDASQTPLSAYEIVHVISNRPDAGGLERARHAGITAQALDHKAFPTRGAFDAALAEAIFAANPDFVVLAGFMRILTEDFVRQFEGRMINIHPSLLPLFKGTNTHERALEAGVAFAGCSVHWVNAGVDEGAIIGQACVPVLPGDTANDLAARVLVQEHRLYPHCLQAVASGQARLASGRNWIDGRLGAISLNYNS